MVWKKNLGQEADIGLTLGNVGLLCQKWEPLVPAINIY